MFAKNIKKLKSERFRLKSHHEGIEWQFAASVFKLRTAFTSLMTTF